ncbi:MAG: UDP-N-acetylmuramoyl-tripeptide--D-alanyl-D-alanine ligase [Pseudomonadota bacterium]
MSDTLWTSADAAIATGGTNSIGWLASGISIDTRSLQPGDLFVALKAARDGHDFVDAAFKAGAAAALVSRPVAGGPTLLVDDVLPALEALGVAARARCSGTRTAVTGSVGKTSVKEMLAAIFSAAGPAHWPEKSFNNHWGVPLTLARMPQLTKRAVFEIGMSTPGEIAPRSEMVRPHCGIITKIAAVHLKGLGTVDAIAAEKSDIFAGLEAGGVAILPADDKYLGYLKERATSYCADAHCLTFGLAEDADARVTSYEPQGHEAAAVINVLGTEVRLRLNAGGAHWAINAAASILAAVAASDIEAADAAEALSEFAPPPGRGQVLELALPSGGTATLVDDSYNANPTSMRAALDALALRPASRRLVALGEMGELGADADQMHAGLATDIEICGVSHAFLAGPGMEPLAKALLQTLPTTHKEKASDLLDLIKNTLRDGDVLLIKGSNASGMGHIARALRDWGGPAPNKMVDASRMGAG